MRPQRHYRSNPSSLRLLYALCGVGKEEAGSDDVKSCFFFFILSLRPYPRTHLRTLQLSGVVALPCAGPRAVHFFRFTLSKIVSLSLSLCGTFPRAEVHRDGYGGGGGRQRNPPVTGTKTKQQQ
ncbi:hypothetical protein TRSC58_07399 [Trypanosoma rangeli SC58]|uniref:Uncharacterized protein n=1 Tax=Trypanosoma rangeli SC58 TaxID=429131 RepID=A0A061ITB1_TRYRA|nr:hypothetical protein TRSC58_07399 [Trypanosoma rangeli SC58]